MRDKVRRSSRYLRRTMSSEAHSCRRPARDRRRPRRLRGGPDLRRRADHRPRRMLLPLAIKTRLVRRGHRGSCCASGWSPPASRVIFTDLQAGSCTMAARRVLREHGRTRCSSPARTCRCCSISCFADAMPPVDGRASRGGARREASIVVHRWSAAVTLELNRIDDRLIHGQVVVGWGQPLDVEFIVLVDDAVAASDWEQELYRMGVPPEMDVRFHDVGRRPRRCSTRIAPTRAPASCSPATSRPCAARRARRRARGERRRHSSSRRPRAAAALRLPDAATKQHGAPRRSRRSARWSRRRTCPPRAPFRSRSCSPRGATCEHRRAPSARAARRPARARRRQLSADDDLAPARRPRRSPARSSATAASGTPRRRRARARSRSPRCRSARRAIRSGARPRRRRRDRRRAHVAAAGRADDRRARRARHGVGRRLDARQAATAGTRTGSRGGAPRSTRVRAAR